MTITYNDIKELRLISEHIRHYEKQGDDVLFCSDWRDIAIYNLEGEPITRKALQKQEGLDFDDRRQLVELLDGYPAREQPEAECIELFRIFMMQRRDKCFHESENWDRLVVLPRPPEAPWLSTRSGTSPI